MPLGIKELDFARADKSAGEMAEEELNRLFPQRKIRRVLLVAPPDVDESLFNYATAKRGRYWNYPAYGLGLIATHLENDGLEADILNLNHQVLKACRLSVSSEDFDFARAWQEVLAKRVAEFHPDIIGLGCMFTQTHQSAVKVCSRIRSIGPQVAIALGGVHITNCFLEDASSFLLQEDFRAADLFFLFEAELAFCDFIRVVNRKAQPDRLRQVYFNSSAKKLYFSKKESPDGSALDVIPAHGLMQSRDLTGYGVVGSFGCFKEENARITTVLANRGCRGQCTYCSVKNFNGPGVRLRSCESIIEELCLLKDKYRISHIMWLDDDLLCGEEHALKLFSAMAERNLGITWDCTNGVLAASCTDEIISAAVRSGCIGLTIGVESGNSDVLKKIKKPAGIDTFLRAAQTVKKYEQIVSRVFLMIGFPQESYRMILDTFNLARKMDLDWYNITIFQPLPNTPLFKAARQGLAEEKFDFKAVRYSSGPFGKIREKADKSIFLSDSSDPFSGIDLDAQPQSGELEEIWFYMNYHLNLARLGKEERPLKLKQHIRYLKYVTELVAPEDPFPLYFYAYLQKKILGSVGQQLTERMENILFRSEYWRKKCSNFNLATSHLRTGDFSFSYSTD